MAKPKIVLLKNVDKKHTSDCERKKQKGKPKRPYNKRFQYSEETLKEAIEKVQCHGMSAKKASQHFGIPRSTLVKKLRNNECTLKKMGPSTVLTDKEEEMIKQWIIHKARIGYPMHPTTVKLAIKKVLDQVPRPNPFKDNMPGQKWFKLFLKRHPEIALKNTEVLSKSRASVTEENIINWFNELEDFLRQENATSILNDPSRIYNMDETGVQLCPKTGKLLGETKEKNNYCISSGQEKENITVLCSYGAHGKAVRPMIVYPYKRFPPKDVAASVPAGFAIGHSPKGWMTKETFDAYIQNCFYKQLVEDKVQFPVLLLLDGHSSHLSLELHDFCKEHGIILYCLFPNATHIIQPCDVGIFRPLKRHWQKVVAERSQTTTESITKSNFAPIFNVAFITASQPEIIREAFKCCGLYPFNPRAPNYSKCLSNRHKDNNLSEIFNDHPVEKVENIILCQIEQDVPEEILNQFREAYSCDSTPGSEPIVYKVWKYLKDFQQSTSHLSNDRCSISTSSYCTKEDKVTLSSCLSTSTDIIITDANQSEMDHGDVLTLEKTCDVTVNVELPDISCSVTDQIDHVTDDIIFDGTLEEYNDLIEKHTLARYDESPTVVIKQDCNSIEKFSILPVENVTQNSSKCETIQENGIIAHQVCNNFEDSLISMESRTEIQQGSVHVCDERSDMGFSSQCPKDVNTHSSCSIQSGSISTNKLEIKHENSSLDKNFVISSDVKMTDVLYPVIDEAISEIALDLTLTSKPTTFHDISVKKEKLENIWAKELHYPEIKKSTKRSRNEKPKIFAVTSEAFKQKELERLQKEDTKNRLKEYNKFKKDLSKKIKLEQDEEKKKEREVRKELLLKKKLEAEERKKEYQQSIDKVLKRKAESLDLETADTQISNKKSKTMTQRKVFGNITNNVRQTVI